MQAAIPAARLEFDDLDAAIEHCYEQGWTDGLPVLPPTERRVQRLIDHVARDPLQVVGIIPPARGVATIEKVAINAAMAGCLPEHFPVVLAAIEAMLDPLFNLNGVQATTHMCAPLVIVSGPAVRELGFNSREGVFGGGSRANAAVGRAVRLVLWNIGGGKPGVNDKATMGHPGKYAFCIAEDPEQCPWEPLHAERGVAAADSAVTVFACEGPHNVSDYWNDAPEGILSVVADCLATLGNNVMDHGGQMLLVLGQEHSRVIARERWSRADVRQFLFERARRPMADLLRSGRGALRAWPEGFDATDPDAMAPVVNSPDDFLVTVAGGPGPHSVICPGWGHYGGFFVTRTIARA